jgi:NAD-dependent deacetylase
MSADSGVPTYRGKGGIWYQYDWETYACQTAFNADPEKVLKFHEVRRRQVFSCKPHAGYNVITDLQNRGHGVYIITQNIDGLHQKAKSHNILELHGSLWRLRCDHCHLSWDEYDEEYSKTNCDNCGRYNRPDIVWFGDMLNNNTINLALDQIHTCDLFVSIGTSGTVWPAAGLPYEAKSAGAFCIEINPSVSENSDMFDVSINGTAAKDLPNLFNLE